MNAELFDPIDPEPSKDSTDENRRASTRFTVGAREVPAKLVIGTDQFPAFLQDWSTSGFRLLVDNVDRWQALDETPSDCFIDVWGSRFAVRYVREYPERNRLCVCFEQKSEGYNPGAMAIPLLENSSWKSGDSFVGAADEFSANAHLADDERPGDDRVHPAAIVCAGVALLALAASLFMNDGPTEQTVVDNTQSDTEAIDSSEPANSNESGDRFANFETFNVAMENVPEVNGAAAQSTPTSLTRASINTDNASRNATGSTARSVRSTSATKPTPKSRQVADKSRPRAAKTTPRPVAKSASKRTPAAEPATPKMIFVNAADASSNFMKVLRDGLRDASGPVTLMVPVPIDADGRATRLLMKDLPKDVAANLRRFLDTGAANSIDDVLAFLDGPALTAKR